MDDMGKRRSDRLLHVLTGIMIGILMAFAILMILVVLFALWYGMPPA